MIKDMQTFYLGVDGGGTHCRARLIDQQGNVLGEEQGGSANINIGIEQAYNEIISLVKSILVKNGLPEETIKEINAGLGLAGLIDAVELKNFSAHPHPFKELTASSDAMAACYGAHGGLDGGIAIFGTGSAGCAVHKKKILLCGGWGFTLGDQGSGAQLGLQTLRQTLLACDNLLEHTPLTQHIFEHFDRIPANIVRWNRTAKPRDFGEFAKITCEYADNGETDAIQLLQHTARHAENLITSFTRKGVERISLLGGLSSALHPYFSQEVHNHLHEPLGDAMDGAIYLAKNPETVRELSL